MPEAPSTATAPVRAGYLFELGVVAAGLWVGFRFDVVPGGQVGVDLLLALAGWWVGARMVADRRGLPAARLALGATWPAVLAALALTIAWVLLTASTTADVLVRGEALGLLGGYGNWHQLAWGPSELGGTRLFTSLQHAWPVAIAAQLLGAWWLLVVAVGRRGSRAVVRVGAVIGSIGVVVALAAPAVGVSDDAILLATPLRGLGFWWGAVLGAAGPSALRWEARARSALAIPGLVLLALAAAAPPDSSWWRDGGSVLAGVAAVVAVAAAVGWADPSAPPPPRPRLLDPWVALVSFVVVHGAVLVVMDADVEGYAQAVAQFGALVAAIAIAVGISVLATTQFRTVDAVERRRVFVPAVGMLLVIVLFSVTGAFAWSSPGPRGDGASAPAEQGP